MTRDDIIRMAEKADLGHAGMECIGFGGGLCSISTIERFAALVAAAEREACAKLCETSAALIWEYHPEQVKTVGESVCINLAAAIRARGQA